jgi:SAM-dependent methyltransferase
MKSFIKRLIVRAKPVLEAFVRFESAMAARWAAASFGRLMWVQWTLKPQPEHFDHRIDQYYQWPKTRNPLWLERGIFSALALKPNGRLLELACGDGFAARNFFSIRCSEVVACDFDIKAISTARAFNQVSNVKFVLADIRNDMPQGVFDNVVWDAAIEHFTPVEIDSILQNIRSRLVPGGVLSGYTIVESGDGVKSLSHHEYEFRDKEDLLRFLAPRFKNVTVFETIYAVRHNLYFWASDSTLPFMSDWHSMVTQSSTSVGLGKVR